MQIPGRTCSVCDSKIATANDAAGCASCDIAWHKDCREAGQICPKCGADVFEQARKEESTAAGKMAASVSTGRLVYILLLILYILLFGFGLSRAFRAEAEFLMLALESVGRLTFFLVIWTYAFTGSAGARKYMGLANAVALFFSPIYLPLEPGPYAFIAGITAFAIWACWFSPQVTAYESTRRRSASSL
ncbi:MAG TPA: hypothetical protein VD994_17320 [Prosthecobacter sp.]|nr:hypothetical protein [Prosthecobacter sp.]